MTARWFVSQVPRIPPQHPLELLARQATAKTAAAVLFGAFDEGGAEAFIQLSPDLGAVIAAFVSSHGA
jgi:hypothetical protein